MLVNLKELLNYKTITRFTKCNREGGGGETTGEGVGR